MDYVAAKFKMEALPGYTAQLPESAVVALFDASVSVPVRVPMSLLMQQLADWGVLSDAREALEATSIAGAAAKRVARELLMMAEQPHQTDMNVGAARFGAAMQILVDETEIPSMTAPRRAELIASGSESRIGWVDAGFPHRPRPSEIRHMRALS